MPGPGDSSENTAAAESANPAKLPKRWEVILLGALCLISLFVTVRVLLYTILPFFIPFGEEAWRRDCRQCRGEWWHNFWRWRLERVAGEDGVLLPREPPPGRDWEWGESSNDTDWFSASTELVSSVVRRYASPADGPVLQVGCGDSPLPAVLHGAGFHASEHIDIAPQVVDEMRERYPAVAWPGLHFEVRDFLADTATNGGGVGGGAPPPSHRFAVVIDKFGIWDWLQEESPRTLPRLLTAVRRALAELPKPGIYVVATKQTPSELQESLVGAAASFAVDATHPLRSGAGSAWAYVLVPL